MKKIIKLNKNKNHALHISEQAQETLLKAINMLRDGTYCPSIIQELDATFNLLKLAKKEVLNCHTKHCLIPKNNRVNS